MFDAAETRRKRRHTMKPSKRSTFATLALATLAGISAADAPKTRAVTLPIDSSIIPARCAPFKEVPADAKTEQVAWNQRLSLAACMQPVEVYIATGTLRGLGTLVANISRAMGPSMTIYQDAIGRGPDQVRLLATYGLGMTYVETMVRARRAIDLQSSIGGSTYGLDRAQFLHNSLEVLLVQPRVAATRAFREVIRMA